MAASIIKEPVKIRRKPLANGNESIYLAIYVKGRREYEFLRLYLIPEKTKADRERNRQTMALANSVKAQRIVEIQSGKFGFKSDSRGKILFYNYFKALAEKRKKEDSECNYSIWISCLGHMMEYDPRKELTFGEISPEWLQGFRDYLEKDAKCFPRSRKGSAKGKDALSQNSKQMYLSKLRTCIKTACKDGILDKDPMAGIAGFRKEQSTREYLTIEEVRAMAATECDCPEIKRAFLFSCLTGLRRSDIVKLTWGEVRKLAGRTRLVFRQKKTGGQEYLDITPQAAELIGERGDMKPDDCVFGDIRFPTYTNDILRIWALRAGIDKHLTFHSGRHTFAVMMLTLGTDIYTVSKLLGHSDLKTTQIYAKIVDAKKQEAVDNIPKIF